MGTTEEFLHEAQKCRRLSFLLLLVVLPLLFLAAVVEISSQKDTPISASLSPSFFGRNAGRGSRLEIRFPTERRNRLLQPKIILQPGFLHESNVKTSVFDFQHGVLRPFQPHGLAVHLFLQLGAYRSSPRAFSITGSISRSMEDYFHPQFECQWVSNNGTTVNAQEAKKYRPGAKFWGLYDSLVIICHFGKDVGVDGQGGKLFISYGHKEKYKTPESFLALTEPPGAYKTTMFEPPFEYDIIYCGSPIYGNVSPQRIREWLAYHAYIFGEHAHFILYDDGGFHEEVQQVLQPWMKLGRVSVQNIRQMGMFHGFDHHRHTIVNDCLLKSQYRANWTFFFDMDEYLSVEPGLHITTLLAEKESQNVTVMTFDQKRMSASLCSLQEHNVENATRYNAISSKLWGFETFVFNMEWHGEHGDESKYAVQGRHVWVTSIHDVVHTKQGRELKALEQIWFHRFPGFATVRAEGCTDFANATAATSQHPYDYNGQKYSADFSLARLGKAIREFELETVGEQPFIL